VVLTSPTQRDERAALAAHHRAVADLLDTVWDPIGVYRGDDSAPPGEYESYAWQVLGHLRDGDSAKEIASVLQGIKAGMMELKPGPEDTRAAEALVTWFRSTAEE
jgi:hypothetical protein